MHGKTQNLREFFRVELSIPVFVRKIFYNKEKDRFFYKDWKRFISKDISGNGIFLYKSKEIELKNNDYVLMKYDLNNDGNFIYIVAKVVRVSDEGYALKYFLVDENKVDEIVKEFLRIDYEKHFKKSEL